MSGKGTPEFDLDASTDDACESCKASLDERNVLRIFDISFCS